MGCNIGVLKVSVDGGSTGIQVGIFADGKYTIENCDPIKGKVGLFEGLLVSSNRV